MPIAPAEAGNLATQSFVVPGLRASAEPEPVISGMIPGNRFRTAAQPAPECFNPGRRPE
jgi:hypothetical protein